MRTAVINKRAGGIGLISGRKAFQRPMAEGVELLNAIQDVYLDDVDHRRLTRRAVPPPVGRPAIGRDQSGVTPPLTRRRRPVERSHLTTRSAELAEQDKGVLVSDTAERTTTAEELDRVIIRFAGDSGDGMQLTGDRFTSASAAVRQRPGHPAGVPGRDPGPGRAPWPASPPSRCTSPTTTSPRRATRPTCSWP